MQYSTNAHAAHRIAMPLARLVAAAGLALDAYVHAKLADQYDPVKATISEGDLFRAEAAAAALAALLVLVWRRLPADALAWLVAAAGLAAILVYRYANVGAHGPLPDMYEPIWTSDKKTAAAAQVVALAATTYLLLSSRIRGRLSAEGAVGTGLG